MVEDLMPQIVEQELDVGYTEGLEKTGLRSLYINNLQSIKELNLTFDNTGVFRIDGDNDIGKSAVLKGVSALFRNVSDREYKSYISDWATTFVVRGEFYDGGVVTLSRGVEDFYEWDIPKGSGKAEKTRGKVPKELEEYFNLYIESEKSNICLNINLPGDRLPFVDTPTSDNYWLLQKSLGTEDYLKGSRFLNKRIKDTNKELKFNMAILEDEVNKLSVLENDVVRETSVLTGVSRFKSVLETEVVNLETLNTINDLNCEIAEMKTTLENIPMLSKEEYYATLKESLELDKLISYYDLLIEINQLKDSQKEVAEILSNLKDLNNHSLENKELQLLDNVLSLNQELEIYRSEKVINNKILNELKPLEEMPQLSGELNSLEMLASAENSLQELLELRKDNNYLLTNLQGLTEIEQITNELSIEEQSLSLMLDIEADKRACLENTTAYSELVTEIEAVKDALGICPLCKSNLSHAH